MKYKEELEKATKRMAELEEQLYIFNEANNKLLGTFSYLVHLLGNKVEIVSNEFNDFVNEYKPQVFYKFMNLEDDGSYTFEYSIEKKEEKPDEETNSGV